MGMNTEDLKIESLDPVKPGGQTVGVSLTGVRVTHIPTGISATCNACRSQYRNKKVAMAMVEYGIAELDPK